ncbi:MAG: IPT/TIG domain-containing protein, partial [Planctomycetota bacterium]|nr:IPT/TIG domain-containing protein [Planctomycetota bacterium]
MRVSAALGLGCLLLSAVGPRIGWAQPTTLTFDELATQPVDGLSFMGVTFRFEIGGVASDDARYRGSGPGTTKFLADPTLEGSASGILTLEFDVPTPILEFGVGLSTTVAVDPGITVELFDSGGSFTVLDVELPSTGGFAQTRFSHAGTPVRRAVIDFNETAAARFAIDNLTFDLTVDTDEDGIPDSVEKKNGLDPEDAADAGGDLDGDGLTNLEEFAAGTDMRNADTDGDGLGDAQEVQGGVTDPLDPDSDGDGALDGEDLFPGFVARVAIETPVAALTTERGMLACRLEDPDGNLLAEAVRFTLTASGAARFADAATVGVVVAGGGTDAVTVETSGGLVEIELVDDLAETVALEVVDSEGFGVTVATSDLLADFEADDGGFLHSGSNDPWRWGVPRSGPAAAASGQRVWATNLTANYPDGVDSRLDSPEIDLPPGSSPRLSFQHYYLGECCCDFAWVQISLSGGAFKDLPGIRGNVGGNRFNCNATNQTYQEVTADLSEFAGESVRIRFRFTTDGSVTGPGWYIDDFQVTGIRAPRLVFLEPHEDADADGLSNAGELARDTDPFDDDTDGDGLLDGAETGTGIFVDVSDTGTDPLNPDSDGDGVSDGDEISRGGFPTDPASVPSGLSPVRVTAVSPASGPATGGTTLRVSGRGFVDGETSVTVGGVAAPAVTFVDSRNLDVVTPPNATGPVAIQVFIPGFTAGRESFTYTPHVLDVSPRIGLEGGGTAVTITGVGFLPGTTLAFDGQAALDVNLESDTLLTATTPAGSGFVDVTLSNADGESPRPRGFRYLPPLGDLDDDGVLNDAEFAAGTAPDDGDSDDDGLSDGVETNSGVFVDENDTGTDPLNPDTDGGGLADGVELSR